MPKLAGIFDTKDWAATSALISQALTESSYVLVNGFCTYVTADREAALRMYRGCIETFASVNGSATICAVTDEDGRNAVGYGIGTRGWHCLYGFSDNEIMLEFADMANTTVQ